MSRAIVVGMNPSQAKTSGTMKKLNSWMTALGVEYFGFINVSSEEGVYNRKSVCYTRLSTAINTDVPVLALGGEASTVLKKIGISHFKLPHPSGRNRLLNDKNFEASCLEECRQYIVAYSAPVKQPL